MPGTPFSEVYDLFLQLCTDYRLLALLNTSEEDFETFVQSWLIFSVRDFSVCNQSLEFDTVNGGFVETLNNENKVILAQLMLKYWMSKLVFDVTQINLHVGDRDFKMPSEAANLKEKKDMLSRQQETCSQLLVSYGYKDTQRWNEWFNQNFQGS